PRRRAPTRLFDWSGCRRHSHSARLRAAIPPARSRETLALPLQFAPVRNDLSRDDVDVEGHRAIARRADFDVMPSGRHAKRLGRRRELAHRADKRSVDEHLGRARRDLEAHTTGVGLTWLYTHRS